jgi:hypothetical protein
LPNCFDIPHSSRTPPPPAPPSPALTHSEFAVFPGAHGVDVALPVLSHHTDTVLRVAFVLPGADAPWNEVGLVSQRAGGRASSTLGITAAFVHGPESTSWQTQLRPPPPPGRRRMGNRGFHRRGLHLAASRPGLADRRRQNVSTCQPRLALRRASTPTGPSQVHRHTVAVARRQLAQGRTGWPPHSDPTLHAGCAWTLTRSRRACRTPSGTLRCGCACGIVVGQTQS